IEFSLRQPLFILLGTLVFVVAGILAFQQLPVEAFPDVSDTQVNVIALYPGRAAEEVERQVTIPIETALSSVPNVVRSFSHTQFGLCFMILTFNEKPSDQQVRQQVLERLRGIDLPAGVEPEMAPLATAIGEIFRFRLKGDHLAPQELRTLQDWVVEKQLRQVPGVADLVNMGGTMKQYEVNPDLAKMRDYKVTLAQLFTALSRANSNAGGGAVSQGRQQFLVRSLGSFRTSADIGDVVVAENKGTPLLVRDVADVRVGSAPAQGLAGQDEADDIVNGIVIMRKGENPSRVLEALKEKIDYVNAKVLPKGVEIVPYYDRSWLIARTLKTVFTNLTEGAMLVTLVLFLFLGNLRAALIVAAIIPLSLLATFLGLTFVGIPANLLSLGAMDFGIIVDGAVIVVENIVRRLGQLTDAGVQDPKKRIAAVRDATFEVGRPTLFSMIIIIAAHIPIFTLQRHEGRIFSPMAWTVTSALIGSLVLSLTLVPLLCLKWLRKDIAHGDNRLVGWLKRRYEPLLRGAIERPRLVVAIAVIALVASIAVGTQLGSEFLPELNEGTTWVNLTLPPSVSPQEAQEQVRAVRAALHTVPEVRTVISKVGRPDDGTDPKIFNSAEFYVDFIPESEWRAGKKKEDIIREMDAAVSQIPGMEPSFSQPIRDNVLESISQVDGQIVIKVRGEDLDRINAEAKQILDRIATVPGVARSFIDREGSLPQYVIDIDRAAAARYGVNVGDIQDLVETALAGKATSELWEGEKHFSVVVRLRPGEREPANLPNLLVATPGGAQVPISRVARFRSISGAMDIARENGRRVVSIGVFIRDRDMGSVVKDMQKRVATGITLAPGDEVTWSGEFENQERAMKRLSWIVPLSIALIFLLLFDAFSSVKSALLIVANIPFAMIGGILALFFTGIPLSVSAAIGFIALFGQAVLNGVVMVTYFNQLRESGLPAREAVIEGSLVRLRTVLMTALLAMFGLLPMALSHAIGAETQRPLAVVVIGGLISATLLTLFVLPTLYRAAYERKTREIPEASPSAAE
ncbi:MAG TPA: CusA/CzcA family heavy metal efflux RND transporter, partial [Usitatibacter sp.]|nr:CusA/CzcA family heavy metal efflux RND transporter [Usitatibacter sp.]